VAIAWRRLKESKLVSARAYVRRYATYFAPTLYAMVPTPVENLTALVGGPMAVTERLVLLYEPDWIADEDPLIIATGLAHEVMHDQSKHILRGKRYPDMKRFNRAGDLSINHALRQQMRQTKQGPVPIWKIAPWFLLPETYGFPPGLTADQYYHLLEELDASDPGAGTKGEGEGDGHPKCTIGAGHCGGIAGNPLGPAFEARMDAEKGRTDADLQVARRETTKQIKKAFEAQHGRGSLPGAFAEIVQAAEEESIIPWEQQLQTVMCYAIGRARAGGLDFSLSRPSRRSYLRGFPIPGLVRRELTVFLVIDSSASMGTKQLQHAVRETAAVLIQTGAENVFLCIVDTAVRMEPQRISLEDLENLNVPGRGGTDFRPAFKAAEEMVPHPDILIYFSDGDGNAPKEPPDNMHTIWCVVPSSYQRIPATWGDVIIISNDPKERRAYEQIVQGNG
jgi:predicted metal-dependent peptidase